MLSPTGKLPEHCRDASPLHRTDPQRKQYIHWPYICGESLVHGNRSCACINCMHTGSVPTGMLFVQTLLTHRNGAYCTYSLYAHRSHAYFPEIINKKGPPHPVGSGVGQAAFSLAVSPREEYDTHGFSHIHTFSALQKMKFRTFLGLFALKIYIYQNSVSKES